MNIEHTNIMESSIQLDRLYTDFERENIFTAVQFGDISKKKAAELLIELRERNKNKSSKQTQKN